MPTAMSGYRARILAEGYARLRQELGRAKGRIEELEQERARLESLVKQLEREKEDLRKKSTRDSLTGLLNRGAFAVVARQSLSGLKRNANSCASLLFLDLDHFKVINDDYGHEAGDEVLKGVAGILRGNLRDGDAVGRIGGEEMAIWLPDASETAAFNKAKNVCELIANEPFAVGSQNLVIAATASIGVASIDPGSETFKGIKPGELLDELLRRADIALYAAKNDGRNRVSCFREESPLGEIPERRFLRRAAR